MQILVIYLVVSLIVGLLDLSAMYYQNIYLSSFPTGDIGSYIKPKHITGLHNILFLPSLLIVLVGIGISNLIDVFRG